MSNKHTAPLLWAHCVKRVCNAVVCIYSSLAACDATEAATTQPTAPLTHPSGSQHPTRCKSIHGIIDGSLNVHTRLKGQEGRRGGGEEGRRKGGEEGRRGGGEGGEEEGRGGEEGRRRKGGGEEGEGRRGGGK